MLPAGLRLRAAVPADLDQIGALLAARGDAADAEDHALAMADPDAGWADCAVVVDGDRVVSTLTLLDERIDVAAPGGPVVRLPAGQVELVATDRDYEGRGLVRALMDWAHECSARRGHIVQLMVGIPYFYRLFGYSYAIDVQPDRPIRSVPQVPPGHTVRPATAADLPTVKSLQDAAQAGSEVRMPHSAACWRWLAVRSGSQLWVAERAGTGGATAVGTVVGAGRTYPVAEGGDLSEVAAADTGAAAALIAHSAARLDGATLSVADRPGTAVADLLAECADPPSTGWANRYYVRIPDIVRLFDELRPVFDARLAVVDAELPGEIIVSMFGSHLRMPLGGQRLGPPVPGGPMQGPWEAGGAGIAPDAVAEVLFGPAGIAGLRRPDVYAGRHAAVMAALFPPVRSDILTFYR